jgi:monoamine oxidase
VLRERAFYAKYAEELSGVERVLRKLDEMAETVPVDAPWLAPEADVWDRVTTGQWYDSQGLSRVARTLLEICTVGILAVPTVEVSLLCLLHNVAVCGVTADLLAESEGGAQTKRSAGGTWRGPSRPATERPNRRSRASERSPRRRAGDIAVAAALLDGPSSSRQSPRGKLSGSTT